ncbi:MAG: cadherin-like domain-containing protein [Candidatus Peribacteraceae bacterium]|nr:cadherin-like domain-containing protein [Candidatus Peribacteraceae bacterium]MBP9850077.1 cadherin-like domain-containing protein [Candidatus Peribacteraceae bacterium]
MVLNGDPLYATNVQSLDVNGDGFVAASDVLNIFNELTRNGSGVFNPFRPGEIVGYFDVNGDGFTTPVDALIVINYLNIYGPGPAPTPAVNNLSPVGFPMNVSVQEGTTIFFVAPFFDPEGGSLDVVVGSDQPDGNLIRQADGYTFSYEAGPFPQADRFSLIAVDDHGQATEVPITINVILGPGPHAPFVRTDDIDVVRNTPREFEVLGNDFDADGDSFSILAHEEPQNGILEDLDNGNFRYTPNVNFEGADAFQYTIRDSTGLEGSGFVRLFVRLNNVPTALNPTLSTREDMPSPTFGVAQLGSDPDQDDLTVTFGTPGNGFIEAVPGGHRYIPNTNFNGTDSVSYRVSDGVEEAQGLITFIVEEPRFTGPMVNRGDLVFAVVEFNGGVLYNHTAQHYQDIGPSHPDYAFIEEAYTEGWIQGGYAAGSRFYVERSVTYGELAYLLDQAFGLPGEDFVSSALAVCAITPDQANRLADNPTRHEVFRAFAAVDHGGSCDLTESELESLARDVATFLGTTY